VFFTGTGKNTVSEFEVMAFSFVCVLDIILHWLEKLINP
jgi:hypothetical protein